MKKYLILAKAEWLDALTNRGEIFLWILLETIPVFVMSSLWLSNSQGALSLGYSFSQIVTYYLVVLVISRLTNHYFDQGIQTEIRQGSFSRFLVKPMPLPISFLAPSIGGKLYTVFFLFAPLLALLSIILKGYIYFPSGENLLLFLGSLVAAFFIQYAFSVFVTAIAFYLEQASAFMHVKWVLENVAGGYVIPISIYPAWAQSILNVLPFKYLYFIPAEIYLGKFTFNESLVQLCISFGWVVVLVFLSHALWKKGVTRYSAVGG